MTPDMFRFLFHTKRDTVDTVRLKCGAQKSGNEMENNPGFKKFHIRILDL